MFVLEFFLVYNRTRTIKHIGRHNGFVKLNGIVLWPCDPVVIHFLLDKVAGPHRKQTVKSFPHQDANEKKESHYSYLNHRLLGLERTMKSFCFLLYKTWKGGTGLGLEILSLFFFWGGHIFLGFRLRGRRISFLHIKQRKVWTIPAFNHGNSSFEWKYSRCNNDTLNAVLYFSRHRIQLV